MVHEYKVGDMVWGKVKSHPWWPGMIFNEAFASQTVCETKKRGCVLVAFYGENKYAWLDGMKLLPFVPHYFEKCKQTNGQLFWKAVEDAKEEISRRAALGLTCRCLNPSKFRPTNCRDFLEVDVSGYELGGLYSTEQIEKAKGDFLPFKTISYIRQLGRGTNEKNNVNFTKNVAEVLAYRKTTFEVIDEPYFQAYGLRPKGVGVVLTDEEKVLIQAPEGGALMIAEATCESKGFAIPKKASDQKQKNKYISEKKGGGQNVKSLDMKSEAAEVSSVNPRVTMEEVEPSAGFSSPHPTTYTNLSKKTESSSLSGQFRRIRTVDALCESKDPQKNGLTGDKIPVVAKITGKTEPVAVVPVKVIGSSSDGRYKKSNIVKCPGPHLNSTNFDMGERMIKTKEVSLLGGGRDRSYKRLKTANSKELPRQNNGASVKVQRNYGPI